MDQQDEQQIAKFRSILEELRKQLLEASMHFGIWEQLWPTEQAVDIINQYKGFFLPTRNAHLDRFFIKVSNIVSNDLRSPSFYRIFKMLDINTDLAPAIDSSSLRKRLKQYKVILEGINNYRNTKAAHWDTSQVAQLKPVLFGDSKRMLKELQDMFNEICGASTKNTWSFKISQHGDTTSLLNALKDLRATKPLVNFTREVKMGEIEELGREEAEWMRKKQELISRRKGLPPQVGQTWYPTPENLAENERLDREIEEAEAKLKEIREKRSKL